MIIKDEQRNDLKRQLIFSEPTMTLLHNKETDIRLIAELDLFNEHIQFYVEDGNFYYDYTYDIEQAVDYFCNRVNMHS
jgi:hypothetical protein